jgi:hypothetical protein
MNLLFVLFFALREANFYLFLGGTNLIKSQRQQQLLTLKQQSSYTEFERERERERERIKVKPELNFFCSTAHCASP